MPKRTLILTRNKAVSKALIDQLPASTWNIHCEPLLDMRFDQPNIISKSPSIDIFTSANAIRAFQINNAVPTSKLAICVGSATYQQAQSLPYSEIINANGNASDIIKLIKESYQPKTMHFVHYRGNHIRTSIKEALESNNYDCSESIVYHTSGKEQLSKEFIEQSASLDNAIIVFFSEQAVGHFFDLYSQLDHCTPFNSLLAVGFSKEISNLLVNRPFKQCYTCSRPDRDALASLLGTLTLN